MRRLLPTLALVILATALPCRAETLRVIAPPAGATLHGGSVAFVEWSASQLPPDSEEWEAFLSIDGGHYYGIRITPHLDIGLRRFSFVVPNFDTANARIMIRTGDEERETRFESPQSFAIVRDGSIAIDPVRLVETGRGESAREGDPAVVEWTDGSRDGSGIRRRFTATAPSRRLAAVVSDFPDTISILLPVHTLTHVTTAATLRRDIAVGHAAARESLLRSTDLLLICRRRNI